MNGANFLFNETFKVVDIDCDVSVGENVNRIHCEGEVTRTDLLLDVFSPLLKVSCGQSLEVLLVKEIQDPNIDYAENGDPIPMVDPLDTDSILPEYSTYEYILHGKVYKIEDKMIGLEPILAVYASFGGLLLRLQMFLSLSGSWVIDDPLFILVKHIQPEVPEPIPMSITHHEKKNKEKKVVCKIELDSS